MTATLLGLLGWRLLRPDEPRFRDRALSYWVIANARRVPEGEFNPEIAIAAIGTNAVPYLVRWMSYKVSPPELWLRKLRNENGLFRKWVPFWATGVDRENRGKSALVAMKCLGPAARPAMAQLTALASNNTDYFTADEATSALCNIGPEAFPTLLTLVTNASISVRLKIIKHFGESGDATALPFLRGALEDLSSSPSGGLIVDTLNSPPSSGWPFREAVSTAIHNIEKRSTNGSGPRSKTVPQNRPQR